MYKAEFDEEWLRYFQRLDNEMKKRTARKIGKILAHPQKRHLRKVDFFVSEIGQYRIIYRIFEANNRVRFYFVGTHKEYEKWYKQLF